MHATPATLRAGRQLLLALGLAASLLQAPAALAADMLPAPAAIARPQSTVEDQFIRLGDLFENAGERASVVLGPAPAPGSSIVVEAAQLSAIARANGLRWVPLSIDDRVTVERPGRQIERDEAVRLLRTELGALGLDSEAEMELPNFTLPLVPVSTFPRLELEGTSLDQASGRFSSTLVVAADGTPTRRVRIVGRSYATAPVVVSSRRLGIGDVVRAEDVKLVRMRAERVREGSAQDLDEVVGMRVGRPLATGMMFAKTDLGEPPAVDRNTAVTMVVEAAGLRLTAQGRALDAASIGAPVRVVNLATRAVVEAEVLSPGVVRVALGAAPLRIDPITRARADNAIRLDAASRVR